MAISSGGISSSDGGQIPDDLAAIYRGGENFLARMKALGDQRAALDNAMAELKLGNDIVGAKSEAVAKSADADALQSAAKKALEEATAQAAAILDEARSTAQGILDTAQKSATATLAQVQSAKADADAYVARTRSDIDAALKDATDKGKQAADLAADMQAKTAAADAAASAAYAAATAHELARQAYEQKVKQIQAVMAAPAG